MIAFNKPFITGTEIDYLRQAIVAGRFSGDGPFTRQCHQWLQENCRIHKALLTTSCTHALELAALLCDLREGDEVIMPSFTFVSTANAFALRGAKIVFVDIRPDTMNIDEKKIERAISPRTKALVVMHYAGVACEMDYIMRLSSQYNLAVIEDAAQCVGATYKNQSLGAIGRLGAYSFHETKNIQCGEGGALLVNDPKYADRAEIIREKGTHRLSFLKGEVDRYCWVDLGSSYLPNELTAAFLYAQLLDSRKVLEKRLALWNLYDRLLSGVVERFSGKSTPFTLPHVPEGCAHNGHIFYIKCENSQIRAKLIAFLKEQDVQSAFHYIPLHTAPAGATFGRFDGEDEFTTRESEKLLRLPLYYDLEAPEVEYIARCIERFYSKS